MLIQSLSCSPLNSTFNMLLVISEAVVALPRRLWNLLSRVTLKRAGVMAGAMVGVVAASLLCLTLSLPLKMIIPSDLLGGIHPASLDLLLSSAHHSLASPR